MDYKLFLLCLLTASLQAGKNSLVGHIIKNLKTSTRQIAQPTQCASKPAEQITLDPKIIEMAKLLNQKRISDKLTISIGIQSLCMLDKLKRQVNFLAQLPSNHNDMLDETELKNIHNTIKKRSDQIARFQKKQSEVENKLREQKITF